MNSEPKNIEIDSNTKCVENVTECAQIVVININETGCEYDNWFPDFSIL